MSTDEIFDTLARDHMALVSNNISNVRLAKKWRLVAEFFAKLHFGPENYAGEIERISKIADAQIAEMERL